MSRRHAPGSQPDESDVLAVSQTCLQCDRNNRQAGKRKLPFDKSLCI